VVTQPLCEQLLFLASFASERLRQSPGERRPTIPVCWLRRPALPVLKCISTFRSAKRQRSRGQGGGVGPVASRPSLASSRLVGRILKEDRRSRSASSRPPRAACVSATATQRGCLARRRDARSRPTVRNTPARGRHRLFLRANTSPPQASHRQRRRLGELRRKGMAALFFPSASRVPMQLHAAPCRAPKSKAVSRVGHSGTSAAAVA